MEKSAVRNEESCKLKTFYDCLIILATANIGGVVREYGDRLYMFSSDTVTITY